MPRPGPMKEPILLVGLHWVAQDWIREHGAEFDRRPREVRSERDVLGYHGGTLVVLHGAAEVRDFGRILERAERARMAVYEPDVYGPR